MISFAKQSSNGSEERVDFTVTSGGKSYDFAISREQLEDLERTAFKTLAQWMPAFEKHKPAIRRAVERHIAAGHAGHGRVLVHV